MPNIRGYTPERPGRVVELLGVIFQSDAESTIGYWFIRPFEALDRWIVGLPPSRGIPPHAIHAGLHLRLEDGSEVVAEQLVGSLSMDFRNGLSWTPIADFRRRDRGGWNVTIPVTAFRAIDAATATRALADLNDIRGRPFILEDCTAFIERAFGERCLFVDSPALRVVGIGLRIGDPALPLLRRDAQLDPQADWLLRGKALRRLPDEPDAPKGRLWLCRLAAGMVVAIAAGFVLARLRAARRESTVRALH